MKIIIWLALCLWFLSTSINARACSCAISTTQELAKGSDIIFRGKLAHHGWGTAVFQVDEQWKGNLSSKVEVEWRRGDRGDCNGFWPELLKVGNELLVFAVRGSDGIYRTSICLPTKLAAKARTEIEELGSGKPPG